MLCIEQPEWFNVFTHAAYKPHNTTHPFKANIGLEEKRKVLELSKCYRVKKRHVRDHDCTCTGVILLKRVSLIFLYHYLISFTSYCELPLSDHKSVRTDLLVKSLAAFNFFHLKDSPETDMVFHLGIPWIHL